MAKTDEEMTFYEKICDYTIIKKEEFSDRTVVTMRTHNGATAICRIPKHTPEEEKELGGRICEAITRFSHPEWDLSKCKYMKIEID